MTYISILIQDIAGPSGKVLIGQKENGKWAFPSGERRTNEAPERACARIAWELLGMDIGVTKLEMRGRHKRPDTLYEYREYYSAVDTWRTEPEKSPYKAVAWVHPSRLASYEFEGDDANFMIKYDAWINGTPIRDVRMY